MQLFDALNKKTWKDEYAIHAWSDEQGREMLVANVSLDQDKNLTIAPTPVGAATYARMGLLPGGANGIYTLNLDEAPVTLVATALGLPGNSHAFMHGLKNELGRDPSAIDIFEVALEGHPSQGGRFTPAGAEDKIMKIREDHLVDLDKDQIEYPADLYLRHTHEYQGLTRHSVLAKHGNHIVPAFLVMIEDAPQANASDRLAIYAAALKEAGAIDGVLADKPLKFVRTPDGKPALICQDATKPSFNVMDVATSNRAPEVKQLCIRRSQLEAKRSLESGASVIHGKDPVGVRAYLQVSALQDLVQDSIGLTVNPPRKTTTGLVRAERLDIPSHMSVEALGAMINVSAQLVSESVNRRAKATHVGNDVGDQTVQKLRSFARKASSYLAEVERLATARMPEEHVPVSRVYDLMELN